MVAIGQTSMRQGDSEEGRLRKLVRDRQSASARRESRQRGRLATSLSTFASADADAVSDEVLETQGLGGMRNLLVMDPREALQTLLGYGQTARDRFVDFKVRAKSRTAWIIAAIRQGNLYHQCLVNMITWLESERLEDEARFLAIEQLFKAVSQKPSEQELDTAVDRFHDMVNRYTKERQRIEDFEKEKVMKILRRASSASILQAKASGKFDKPEKERENLGEDLYEQEEDNSDKNIDDAIASVSAEGDEDDSEEELLNNQYAVLREAYDASPFLRTTSGKLVQTKLTQKPARLSMDREFLNEDTIGYAVGHNATTTDVTRDLSSLAKKILSEEAAEGRQDPGPTRAEFGAKRSLSVRSDDDTSQVSSATGSTQNKSQLRAMFAHSLQSLQNKDLFKTMVRLLRTQIWEAFEDPSSSQGAYYLVLFSMILIFLSCVTFCVETMPKYRLAGVSKDVFRSLEIFVIIMFTLEYVLRSVCCPRWRRFITHPLNVVDLVAILPFYLELFLPLSVSGFQILRMVRLVRVLRLVKLGSKFRRLSIIATSLAECSDMLLVSLGIAGVSMVTFSTLIYYAEHGDYVAASGFYSRKTDVVCEGVSDNVTSIYLSDGSLVNGCYRVESPYKSVPASFWWCVVTLMTVGYGDNVPVTVSGKLVASMTMVASVLLLALPISVIGTEFTRQWLAYRIDAEVENGRKLVAPRARKVFDALKLQAKKAEDAQLDLRARAIDLDDRVQTIKSIVQRRKGESTYVRRKLAIKSNITKGSVDKLRSTLNIDDLDRELYGLFMSHRDLKTTEREVRTIWSGQKLLQYTEFLISAENVVQSLCNDDFELVTQEIGSLFFDIWRARVQLASAYRPKQEAPAAAP
ncbi:Voltage-dependent channel, four helix bundle domain [Ostreococcus tauri]|uniref:Voltage-dependent channel, four helix bundle domain n=1 Tax=Ostreococcus tauri TaxID=70448 RepID=A0A090MD79_OSTTA|nr:Voltage-dependent channel, four helix bundle domain [Ostreococcus tauri]CEG00014.1 Voltage-dependent channel, four helix bundle domain [Ostreococcus tauri]|eukprot:XP_022840154.1 Voltage-dependent channel, four helix bundle domain [Ostreococcus tauri]